MLDFSADWNRYSALYDIGNQTQGVGIVEIESQFQIWLKISHRKLVLQYVMVVTKKTRPRAVIASNHVKCQATIIFEV